MSYHPRIYAPGLLYHLIAWRNNEQVMDLEPATYETFLKTLYCALFLAYLKHVQCDTDVWERVARFRCDAD